MFSGMLVFPWKEFFDKRSGGLRGEVDKLLQNMADELNGALSSKDTLVRAQRERSAKIKLKIKRSCFEN